MGICQECGKHGESVPGSECVDCYLKKRRERGRIRRDSAAGRLLYAVIGDLEKDVFMEERRIEAFEELNAPTNRMRCACRVDGMNHALKKIRTVLTTG